MDLFVNAFFYVLAALLPMVNPLSGSVFFVSLTSDLSESQRAWLSGRVAIYSFVMIEVSVYVGVFILNFFGISIDVLRVAGGLVLACAGWSAINSEVDDKKKAQASKEKSFDGSTDDFKRRAFFPLTMPLMVGPGAMSVCTALGTTMPMTLSNILGLHAAILVNCIAVWVSFRYSDQITKRMGASGADAVVKIFSFLLICIGIQILWTGFSGLWTELAKTSLAFLAK